LAALAQLVQFGLAVSVRTRAATEFNLDEVRRKRVVVSERD
jgi:hypothetical protein